MLQTERLCAKKEAKVSISLDHKAIKDANQGKNNYHSSRSDRESVPFTKSYSECPLRDLYLLLFFPPLVTNLHNTYACI